MPAPGVVVLVVSRCCAGSGGRRRDASGPAGGQGPRERPRRRAVRVPRDPRAESPGRGSACSCRRSSPGLPRRAVAAALGTCSVCRALYSSSREGGPIPARVTARRTWAALGDVQGRRSGRVRNPRRTRGRSVSWWGGADAVGPLCDVLPAGCSAGRAPSVACVPRVRRARRVLRRPSQTRHRPLYLGRCSCWTWLGARVLVVDALTGAGARPREGGDRARTGPRVSSARDRGGARTAVGWRCCATAPPFGPRWHSGRSARPGSRDGSTRPLPPGADAVVVSWWSYPRECTRRFRGPAAAVLVADARTAGLGWGRSETCSRPT